MNESELRAILARNPAITINDPHRGEVRNSVPESNAAATLDSMEKREGESQACVRVRFTGYRVRLLDPDNFAGSVKDLLDCLRQSLLIVDDSPDHIILETTQQKVGTRKEERTEIVITYDNP